MASKNKLLSLDSVGLLAATVILGAFAVILGTALYNVQTRGSVDASNGAPSGPHFNLNIIGVPKSKTATMTSGNRIFVPLVGNCQINLSQGNFAVLDANCTDGKSGFQLPSPDPANTGITTYSVYARALGKPGGRSTTTTCATDPLTGELWCSVYAMIQVRSTGKSTFTNVSKELLYIYADINADGRLERYPLFDSALQDYYWNYDNSGMKLMQLRFYQVPTNVN